MITEEHRDKMDQVVARFTADELFRQELLANPAGILTAAGIEIPAALEVSAAVNDAGELLLMTKPASGELSEDDLAAVSGGAGSWSVMAGYSVWNANRKVFLSPENWLDPQP